MKLQWNPDFSNPRFFEPPDNSNQKSFPLLSRTLKFYPPISRTPRFFEPIFVSLIQKIGSPLYCMPYGLKTQFSGITFSTFYRIHFPGSHLSVSGSETIWFMSSFYRFEETPYYLCLLMKVVWQMFYPIWYSTPSSLVFVIFLFRLSVPLPEKISMEVASLPDYLVSDVAEFLLFVNM